MKNQQSPIIFLPHGGGSLPLLGDTNHQEMIKFMHEISPSLAIPASILIISAHWEEEIVTITSGNNPSLIYDYYGFPEESYQLEYPAPGEPVVAKKISDLLRENGIESKLSDQRGFDHGLFVPLKILFPEANIPCVQLSLLNNLDPESHLKIGKALSKLSSENTLIIGSGLSFHNMWSLMSLQNSLDHKNEEFEMWLIDACTNQNYAPNVREQKLIKWTEAPFLRYCQPREEDLLPLHVCAGE